MGIKALKCSKTSAQLHFPLWFKSTHQALHCPAFPKSALQVRGSVYLGMQLKKKGHVGKKNPTTHKGHFRKSRCCKLNL